MTNEYLKQANDFLTKTNTTIKKEFLKYDYHFEGEETKRDIYLITITRGNRSFNFNFGQSINDSGFYYTRGVFRGDLDRTLIEKRELREYIRCRIDGNFNPSNPNDKIHFPVEPCNYSILACLQNYEAGTFKDFCEDFGYDKDSKKAEKIYNAVIKEFTNVQKIWNDEEIEELAEIN